MIGCDRLNVHIQRVQNSCTRGTLGVKLDEAGMCIHGLGTHETERLSMNRIVDMISIEMLTTETILDSRDDRT